MMHSGGVIQCGRIHQVIQFEGLRFGSITPTDIDAVVEYDDKAVILMEFKLKGNEMPYGQKLCLERIAKDIDMAGRLAVVLLCEHEVYDVSKPVIAKDARVKEFYYRGKWNDADGSTVERYISGFMKYAKRKVA